MIKPDNKVLVVGSSQYQCRCSICKQIFHSDNKRQTWCGCGAKEQIEPEPEPVFIGIEDTVYIPFRVLTLDAKKGLIGVKNDISGIHSVVHAAKIRTIKDEDGNELKVV